MNGDLSPRLSAIVAALPLRPGLRVLEIGCGPGAAARVVARLIGDGFVLGIDRSAKAIAQAIAGSHAELASGRLAFRQVAIERFELEDGEAPYHIAFAVRVGALDGRHPQLEQLTHERIRRALIPGGRLYVDGGAPLRQILLDDVASSLTIRATPNTRLRPGTEMAAKRQPRSRTPRWTTRQQK